MKIVVVVIIIKI